MKRMRRRYASTTVSPTARASSSTARTLCRASSAPRRKYERDRSGALPIPSSSKGRLRDSGRSLPDGLEYVDSWVEPNFGRCFQLMRCDDMRLLQKWVLQWRGSGATFEIIPVVPSTETREVVAPYLEAPSENS